MQRQFRNRDVWAAADADRAGARADPRRPARAPAGAHARRGGLGRPPGGYRGAAPRRIAAAGSALLLALAFAACRQSDPPPIGDEPFVDDFDRDEIGTDYRPTDRDAYDIGDDGRLRAEGAVNHPLWLRKKLPRDVAIEFDAWSYSEEGDIKVELYGDGEHHAEDRGQYTSTGYVAVMGGWNNSRSILAKGDEHGEDLDERRRPRVEPGERYRWRIVREGEELRWYVDDMDEPFLELEDSDPLYGEDHAYFGFNNWESDTRFDNLEITPL